MARFNGKLLARAQRSTPSISADRESEQLAGTMMWAVSSANLTSVFMSQVALRSLAVGLTAYDAGPTADPCITH